MPWLNKFVLILLLTLGWAGVSQAITPTLLTSSTDGDGTQTATTASITPTADRPVVAMLMGVGTGGFSSVSGAGLTWTQRRSFNLTGDTNYHLEIWTGVSASPSSGALTLTATNASTDRISWIIADLTGASTTPWAANAANNEGTGTTGTATISALASATNCVISFLVFFDEDTIVPEAGYTEITQTNAPFASIQAQYRADNGDVTPAATFGSSAMWGMIGFEIAEAAAGGSVNFFPRRLQVNP